MVPVSGSAYTYTYGVLGELLAYYEAHIADHTVPYPGCLEALDALAGRGCKLAVVTNSTYDGLCYNAELIKQTLAGSVEVHITHIKPGEMEAVMSEIGKLASSHRIRALAAMA